MKWKRATGDNNILKSFGYCEFTSAESVQRALRVLNGFKLGANQLKVRALLAPVATALLLRAAIICDPAIPFTNPRAYQMCMRGQSGRALAILCVP